MLLVVDNFSLKMSAIINIVVDNFIFHLKYLYYGTTFYDTIFTS
jgi:hypothetical protein